MNPFGVVRDFEKAIADYTGASYVVTVNSCTMALLLALHGAKQKAPFLMAVYIPSKTYVSVPSSIHHAGLWAKFTDEEWAGAYQIKPTNIWDCALRFTSGMYVPGQIQCVSFHPRKPFHLENGGGAILHDDAAMDAWYRRARFDGRTEGLPTAEDHFQFPNWHCYMMPGPAAAGLQRLSVYPRDVPDMPNDDYPDLSERFHA